MRIFDSHQHFWELDRYRLPWLEAPEARPLARDFRLRDYLAEAAECGIEKTIYVEADVAPESRREESEYVLGLCERGDTPLVAAVIHGHPGQPGFRDNVLRFQSNPFCKGVRQILHADLPAGHCLAEPFVNDIGWLGERDLSFDLCVRPGELPDAARLAERCPGTQFVLDHCGNPNTSERNCQAWEADLARVAARANVCCKVSGLLASARPGWSTEDLEPFVRHTIDVFGPDRVLFGSNWPVCTLGGSLRQWVDALRQIVSGRTADENRRLFYENAVRVYR